ncbi:MAG TPA: hypothetical protein VHA37_00125, partial [Candidatus Saccharimonadales bacterium]|nr:hypothetical protein [Candidatus Saccharimonadales bacterium]
MPSAVKIRSPQRARLLIAGLLLLVALPGFVAGVPAAADPPDSVLTTVSYCKSHMPKAVDDQCTEANMNHIRAAFQDDCNKKANCIESKAEDVLDTVAKAKPKNKGDFNDAVDAALKDAAKGGGHGGGSPSSGDPGTGGPTPTGQGSNCDSDSCDLISLYVNPAISLLSILVGLVCAGSLVMAGIQYTTASGDPQKVGAAKT